jgi:hypothetical protein
MTERIVLLAYLCLLATTAAGQTLLYVSPSGSDANPGTAALPFQTIGKAAQVVNPGDTVMVENGVYHEALNLTRGGTANAYVTFQSQTKWGAVLDGNQNSLAEAVQFTANYIRFQGFEIRGYGANGSADAFSNYPGGQFLDIAQNYIHDIGRLCTSTTNGLVGDATPGGVTFSGNLTNTDPRLVNAGNSTMDDPVQVDAHLSSGSPAIGGGLTVADVTNDYEGTTRPPGSGYDIGAFEFGGAGAAAKPLAPTGLSVTVY